MWFIDTCLQEHIPDSRVSLPAFQTIRAHRDLKRSIKSKASRKGQCLKTTLFLQPGFWTISWAFILIVYQEFTSVIEVAGYIPVSVGAETVCDVISSGVATIHHITIVGICGDIWWFQPRLFLCHVFMNKSYSTKENKMLNLFYSNVRDAYSSSTWPTFGQITI